METQNPSSQFAESALVQQHICAFFNSIDEQHRVLRSFIKDGFDRGDRAFHLVDPEKREEHLRRLADGGYQRGRGDRHGQLEVRPWQDGPLHGNRFDQDTWLASFEQVLQSGPEAGYAQTRFLAQMEWALVDLPGVDDLIEFETRVNYVVPKYDDAVICAYDLSRFGADVVIYRCGRIRLSSSAACSRRTPSSCLPTRCSSSYGSHDRLTRAQRPRSRCLETPMPRSRACEACSEIWWRFPLSRRRGPAENRGLSLPVWPTRWSGSCSWTLPSYVCAIRVTPSTSAGERLEGVSRVAGTPSRREGRGLR